MARDTLNVWINLDQVRCHDEGDGWGSAEPYLWAVFFKIDGSGVRLNDALNLEGTATVAATYGAHGNLGDTDVDAGDVLTVPGNVGSWSTLLQPIPVAESVRPLADDVAGAAGVVVVLMEEDNVTDAGAIAGYNALVTELQQRLDALIPTLGFTHPDVTDEDVAVLREGLDDAISDAIAGAQSGFQNLWSWLNADDQVGNAYFSFGHDTLADGQVHEVSQRWDNEGDWEITGHANASVACPASAAAALSARGDGSFGAAQLESLRRFRDAQVTPNPTLGRWWELAQRNSAALGHLVATDPQAREAMLSVLPKVTRLLADGSATIPDDVVASVHTVLRRAGHSPSRQLRLDAQLADQLVAMVPGRTVKQAVQLGSRIEPTRRLSNAHVVAVAREVLVGRTPNPDPPGPVPPVPPVPPGPVPPGPPVPPVPPDPPGPVPPVPPVPPGPTPPGPPDPPGPVPPGPVPPGPGPRPTPPVPDPPRPVPPRPDPPGPTPGPRPSPAPGPSPEPRPMPRPPTPDPPGPR